MAVTQNSLCTARQCTDSQPSCWSRSMWSCKTIQRCLGRVRWELLAVIKEDKWAWSAVNLNAPEWGCFYPLPLQELISMGQECTIGHFAFWICSVSLPLQTSPESCKEMATKDDASLYGISKIMDLRHLPCVCGRRLLLLHWLSPVLIFFNFWWYCPNQYF